MRPTLVVTYVALAGCGFSVPGSSNDGADPRRDGAIDTALDTAVDPDDMSSSEPDAPVDTMPPPPRTIDPATDWEMSANGGTTWTQTALPHTGWGCDNCTRLYRVAVIGRPTAAVFRFASDNKARMLINGTAAFEQYWIDGYCSDQLCCSRCCDTPANCAARLSEEMDFTPAMLELFTDGTNIVQWEVREEIGGEGFTSTMTVTY